MELYLHSPHMPYVCVWGGGGSYVSPSPDSIMRHITSCHISGVGTQYVVIKSVIKITPQLYETFTRIRLKNVGVCVNNKLGNVRLRAS
jgi:hypothetical protein